MAQTITTFDFSVPGKVRAIGSTEYYPFTYSGPALATVDDLKAMQAAIIAAFGAAPSAGSGSVQAPPISALTNPTAYKPGWTVLMLTPEDDIGAAVGVAAKGFKLLLAPGTYRQVFNVPSGLDGWEIASSTGKASDVVLDGGGGLTVADNNKGDRSMPGRLASGKGVVHAASPGHIHDLTITGGGLKATDGHDGQAGLYWECSNGDTRATRCILRANQNGAFGNATNANVHYICDTCLFEGNSTDGGSHDTYFVCSDTTTSRASYLNCHAEGSNYGNNFKSRVPFVDIVGGFHGSKGMNRWVEAADGSIMTINGGTFVANDGGQNVFGNGTESTSKGPGNTTWNGSIIYIGNRSANFSNAGTFQGTNLTVLWTGPNGSIFNDKGQPLSGLPGNPGSGFVPYPAVPPYVSGATG